MNGTDQIRCNVLLLSITDFCLKMFFLNSKNILGILVEFHIQTVKC